MKQRSRHLKKKLLNCSILWNQHNDQVPIGLLAQLVEHCIAEVMGSNPVQIWIFFRPYFHYFQTVFITAKVALIFTSLSAVHIHDFRIFTVIYSYNCNLNRSAEHQVKALPDIHAILHSIPGKRSIPRGLNGIQEVPTHSNKNLNRSKTSSKVYWFHTIVWEILYSLTHSVWMTWVLKHQEMSNWKKLVKTKSSVYFTWTLRGAPRFPQFVRHWGSFRRHRFTRTMDSAVEKGYVHNLSTYCIFDMNANIKIA